MSNSIIAHKYLAEDLVCCPGGALLGERACTSVFPCSYTVPHQELTHPGWGSALDPHWRLEALQRNRGAEDKGTLEIEVAN